LAYGVAGPELLGLDGGDRARVQIAQVRDDLLTGVPDDHTQVFRVDGAGGQHAVP
jgi:hypothetical protein